MIARDREYIGACIRYELQKGIHTFTMCKCGRNGTRSGKCWECWLSDLINNISPDFSIKESASLKEGKK